MVTFSDVEDAFLRKEWTQALHDSHKILSERLVQLQQEASAITVMTIEEERVLSVYIQAIFELDLQDEVDTAASIIKAFTPLQNRVTFLWSKFLMAMSRRDMAKQVLGDLLASLAGNKDDVDQYIKAAEMIALQLLLPDEGVRAAQLFVKNDTVLDDTVKLQLLRRIQSLSLQSQEATENTEKLSTVRHNARLKRGDLQTTDSMYQAAKSDSKHDDESSCYVVLGGTAIALAVVAAGALQYRGKICEYFSSAVPAIIKSVRDAKYALFEA